jgi:high-affinity iron transporter
VLGNLLIGLREGLEASLIVSILVAYLVKTGRRDRLNDVWLGVAAAVVLAVACSIALSTASDAMTFKAQEAFGGVMSIVAVSLVTWMIFWMRRTARLLKAELEGRVSQAMSMGRLALASIAFVSVAREGIETALIVWSSTQARTGTAPFVGTTLGLAIAVVLGYLIYRSAVHINLGKFFTYTAYGLVVVAAGVLAYGFHDLQEAGILPGLTHTVFDISSTIPPSSWYGTLLKGAFNFNAAPTYLEFTVWIVYLVTVMTLLSVPRRSTHAPRQAPASRVHAS